MTLLIDPDTAFGDQAVMEWQRSNGIEPSDTYKIAVNDQTMIASVFQYKRNAEGKHFYDPTIDDVASIWFTKQVTSLPPSGFIAIDAAGFRVFSK